METTPRNLAVLPCLSHGPRLGVVAATLILGNLLDALFTLTFLQLHVVYEANPLMRWVYEGSPLSFVIAKLASVQLGFLLLWLHRNVPAAQMAMVAGAMAYTAVVAYHLCLLAVLPSLLRS
jgi:hypothetical protein